MRNKMSKNGWKSFFARIVSILAVISVAEIAKADLDLDIDEYYLNQAKCIYSITEIGCHGFGWEHSLVSMACSAEIVYESKVDGQIRTFEKQGRYFRAEGWFAHKKATKGARAQLAAELVAFRNLPMCEKNP